LFLNRSENQTLIKQLENMERRNAKQICDFEENLEILNIDLETKSDALRETDLSKVQLMQENENVRKNLDDKSTEVERLKQENTALSAELNKTRMELTTAKLRVVNVDQKASGYNSQTEKENTDEVKGETSTEECSPSKLELLTEENEQTRPQVIQKKRKPEVRHAETQTICEQDTGAFAEAPVALVAPSRTNVPIDHAIDSPERDRSADVEWIEKRSQTSEVKRLHDRCLKLERLLVSKEKQLSILSGTNSELKRAGEAGLPTSSCAQAYDVTGSEKTMENLIDFEIDAVSNIASGLRQEACSSDAEVSSVKSFDLAESVNFNEPKQEVRLKAIDEATQAALLQENKRLRTRLHEIEEALVVCGNENVAKRIYELREENNQLLAKLDEAARTVPSPVKVQRRIERVRHRIELVFRYTTVLENLRRALSLLFNNPA